jgi:hypothetical protein
VYEGTGDARADVDDMVYLDSENHMDERWMWVTTRIAKQRALLYQRSFHVNYKVFPAIVTELKEVQKVLEPTERVVSDAMKDALADGPMNQSELVSYLSNNTPYARDKLKLMAGAEWAELNAPKGDSYDGITLLSGIRLSF